MTDAEPALNYPRLHLPLKVEQAERVGHGNPASAHLFRDVLLLELKFRGEAFVGACLLDRVQVRPLQVFDQRDFHDLLITRRSHDDRRMLQPKRRRRAPAALAGDELIFRADPSRHEGLDDALLADGIHQLAQRLLPKFAPWLQRTRDDVGDRNLQHAVTGRQGNRRGRSTWNQRA